MVHRAASPIALFLILLSSGAPLGEPPVAGADLPADPRRSPPPFRLKDAAGPPASAGRPEARGAPPEEGKPLEAGEAARIFSRLPPLPVEEPGGKVLFPAVTAIRPRPGRTIEAPIPAPAGPEPPPPAGPLGPLEILRRSPEGEAPFAESISVTFSEPMVPLAAAGDLALRRFPVSLDPPVPGAWRWAGTRTLIFEPGDGRRKAPFPRATVFRLEVPAGTGSVRGARLAETAAWTFATPPPRLTHVHPWTRIVQPLDPPFILAFDQRVDGQKVLGAVRLEAEGRTFPLRLAEKEEIEAAGVIRLWEKSHENIGHLPLAELWSIRKGTWAALRPANPLPPGSEAILRLPAGSRFSAEGPRPTAREESIRFRIRGPLRVRDHYCGRYSKSDEPGCPLTVEFTNPLDRETFAASMVRVEPDLPGIEFEIQGNELRIEGPTRARTEYRVDLSPAIRDAFGQILAEESALSFEVGAPSPPSPWIEGPDGFIVLDPFLPPAYQVITGAVETLKVRAYRVGPADWPAWRKFRKDLHAFRYGEPEERPKEEPRPPGALVLDRAVPAAAPGRPGATSIDLTPALEGGLGQLIVVVDAGTPEEPEISWVQSTRIGLEAFADAGEMVVLASALPDGSPLEGIEVELFPGGGKGRTGIDGVAAIPFAEGDAGEALVIARRGKDLAFVARNEDWQDDDPWGKAWMRRWA